MFVSPASRSARKRPSLIHPNAIPGRLTLLSDATASPVMTTDQASKTTVYWSPNFGGQWLPLWNGREFVPTDMGGQLSNLSTASSSGAAGPAAVTTNANYDFFAWFPGRGNKGLLTRGPAWSSDTSRGTGAGTTEIELLKGIWVNKYAIANGPPARRGIYLGSARSDGSSQFNWLLGSRAAGGTAALLGLWNMYNRIPMFPQVTNTTASYTWAPGGSTTRSAANSTAMRISFISGLAEDAFQAAYHSIGQNSNAWSAGIGYDSTTTFSGAGFYGALSTAETGSGSYRTTAVGYHYFQALEWTGSGTTTFYGAPGTGPDGLVLSAAMRM